MRHNERATSPEIPAGGVSSLMANAAIRQQRFVWIGFVAVLAFAWFCYQPAISGAFQLDDEFNLGGLAQIEDAQSAFSYIFSGMSGPTGRPLALASFAVQADSWEQGASAFLRANILIHLLNAALLAVCLYQLSRHRAIARVDAAVVAAVAATLWVLMPLLATASLLVVQRMTTLSAMFMLLGLNGYLFARARIHAGEKQALTSMGASLVIGTVLASLCKESGLLLPVFVLILEATILERPDGIAPRTWRKWQLIFLASPLALLLIYLGTWLDYPDATIASRGFNAWERLLTESRILWTYVLKALAGFPEKLGIYQDPPTVSRSLFDPATFIAGISWLALLVASIAWRRRYPLVAFAVLWFLAGHLIESSVVPLELYFEHRNYVPIIGPVFALCSFVFLLPESRRRIAAVPIAALVIANAWFLYSFAILSGTPSFAARYWAAIYPHSQRAVARMASYQLAEEGPEHAIATIDMFVEVHPKHAYMHLPKLQILCQHAPDEDHRQIVSQLHRELPVVEFTYSAAVMLFELYEAVSETDCTGIDTETVVALAGTLRENPRYADEPLYNQAYHKMLAAVARKEGDYNSVVEHLQKAIRYRPSLDLNHMVVSALLRSGKVQAAREFVESAESLAPAHPVKAMMWRRDLDELRKYVQLSEQSAKIRPKG